MKSFIDILLFPERIYKKITDSKPALYAGIIFIGAADLIFPYIVEAFTGLFTQKTLFVLILNIVLSMVFIILIGILDVAFFSLPLFDLFRLIKKRMGEKVPENLRIKLMKVYIMAHFVIVPVNIAIYYLLENLSLEDNMTMVNITFFVIICVYIWFSAIISRGINTIYGFGKELKRVVFLIVFLWSFLLGWALEYIINNLIIKILV